MAIFEKLGNYRSTALLIMRVGLGAAMIMYGYPKLLGGPAMWSKIGLSMGDIGIHFAPTFWGFMAAFAEAIGGLLVVLGLFFRPACFLILFTLAMATLHHVKAHDEFMKVLHPLELAVAFTGLFLLGPGRYSIDKK